MCKQFEATANISRKDWDAIQASFEVDFRCVDDNNDPLPENQIDPDFHHLDVQAMSDTIKKYDLHCGSNPIGFVFKFEDGVEIYMDWFVEEFGGVVRWGDNDYNSFDEHDMALEKETVFEETESDTGNVVAKYICRFNIID